MKHLIERLDLDRSSKKYALQREVEDEFLKEGFSYIELPGVISLADSALFKPIYHKKGNGSVVKLLGGNSDVLLLKPDNTIAILQALIPKWQKGNEKKVFYNSPVYRLDTRSKIAEIGQLGVEWFGGSNLKSCREIMVLALTILAKSDKSFLFEISNSRYLQGLLAEIKAEDQVKQVIAEFIYRKNQYEMADFLSTVAMSKDVRDCLLNIFRLQGDILTVIGKAQNYFTNDVMSAALEELAVLGNHLAQRGFAHNVHYDLSMVMELNYYDGVMFRGFYPNSCRGVVSGGRYDALTKEFGAEVPAIGFSVELAELIKVF